MAAVDPVLDLSRILNLEAFEPIAAERMDPAAYDYVAGGSWDEITLVEAVEAWRRRRLRPRVLVDVSGMDPSTMLLGARASLPVAIAPMAAQGLANPGAESAMARAAAAAGVPVIVSTMSTHSMEEVAAAAPDATRWFQLYTQAEPARTRSLVERAEAAGYSAIVVTVDLPELGYRERDLRSGFNLSVELGNFRDALPSHASHGGDDSGYDILNEQVETGLDWRGIATIRSWTSLPVVLKGILTAEDARIACDEGVDGIAVSNHGARQLDRAVVALDVLEEIAAAVAGRTEIWVDGGVRRGLDVLIARALGARGVLLGRPAYWALAAAGQPGVERALEILRTEIRVGMTLLGTPTVDSITRAHVAG